MQGCFSFIYLDMEEDFIFIREKIIYKENLGSLKLHGVLNHPKLWILTFTFRNYLLFLKIYDGKQKRS